MRFGSRAFVPALLSLFLLAACAEGPTEPHPKITELPRELSADEIRVARAGNDFAFDLLRQSLEESPGAANIFLSPLSASMALGMAMNGADGGTWAQMRHVLGFAGMDEPSINRAYRDLIALLLDLDPAVTFGLANSVWARRSFPFVPEFHERVTTWFDAEARELDFADPAAPGVINAWVRNATGGRIEEIVGEISPLDIMFLINAVHFKGTWVHPFDRRRTSPAPFRRADGSMSQVDMMRGEVGHRVLFTPDGGAAVELPYGGGAFTAVAVLPPAGETIAGLLAGLDAPVWDGWMRALEESAGAGGEQGMLVAFPRFELAYQQQLTQTLQALGMVDVFDDRLADLSRLTPAPDAYISSVLQKTYLRVDEEGTEAAAATSVTVSVTSMPQAIEFDRPFLFALRERFSGTILFMGVIGDPAA